MKVFKKDRVYSSDSNPFLVRVTKVWRNWKTSRMALVEYESIAPGGDAVQASDSPSELLRSMIHHGYSYFGDIRRRKDDKS